ncbi:MAG: 50S ribosomal protein L13 [Thermoprotei archaeon]|nr:MAG: 50S ribosomal protein L13 [Thermoprotei archaeon]HDJ95032.1 50S ribosomal protein L13 [Acidilobales archaeon]
MTSETIINGEGHILGRLASIVAKRLLNGERITILNADKIVVSGDRKMVIESYKLLFEVGTLRNPYRHGVRRPRSPENIVRRAIRGMLPIDKPKGRAAYRRLKVFSGIPPEYSDKADKMIKIEDALATRLGRKYTTLAEVAIQMGWKPKTQLR